MAKRMLLSGGPEPASYTLIGISTQLRDYRLSFLVNQALEFSLAKFEDISIVPDGKKEPVCFSIFSYRDEDQFTNYHLLSNRAGDQFLIPKYRHSDYILFVEGKLKKSRKSELMARIRQIANVLAVFEIPAAEVKNLDTILSDLELNFPCS